MFKVKVIVFLALLVVAASESYAVTGHYFDGYWEEEQNSSYEFIPSGFDSPGTMAGIIYAEAASFRPATRGGPNNPEGREATKEDRDQIYQHIALVLKCRKKQGRDRGTAPPTDLTNINNPSKDAAIAAANAVDAAWNSADAATKDQICKTNTHFWMECWRWDGEIKVPTLTTSAGWVTALKKDKSNYTCLPPGDGAAIQNGDGNPPEWCTYCFPNVPVK